MLAWHGGTKRRGHRFERVVRGPASQAKEGDGSVARIIALRGASKRKIEPCKTSKDVKRLRRDSRVPREDGGTLRVSCDETRLCDRPSTPGEKKREIEASNEPFETKLNPRMAKREIESESRQPPSMAGAGVDGSERMKRRSRETCSMASLTKCMRTSEELPGTVFRDILSGCIPFDGKTMKETSEEGFVTLLPAVAHRRPRPNTVRSAVVSNTSEGS